MQDRRMTFSSSLEIEIYVLHISFDLLINAITTTQLTFFYLPDTVLSVLYSLGTSQGLFPLYSLEI